MWWCSDANSDTNSDTNPDPDTADESHAVLDSLDEHKRTAAAALLDLPDDLPLAGIADPDTGAVVGTLTADSLLADLRTGAASPDTVLRILAQRRAIRPGLAGAT